MVSYVFDNQGRRKFFLLSGQSWQEVGIVVGVARTFWKLDLGSELASAKVNVSTTMGLVLLLWFRY